MDTIDQQVTGEIISPERFRAEMSQRGTERPEKGEVISPRDALAIKVVGRCHSLRDIADEIRALWEEFNTLPRGEMILGCKTRTEFCFRHLGCTLRAVRYALENKEPKKQHPKVKRKQYLYDGDNDIIRCKTSTDKKLRERLLRDALTEVIIQKEAAVSCGDSMPADLLLAINEAEKILRRVL